jgi:hypothetical protein
MWGDHLGVVDLVLNNDAGQWRVAQAKAEARPSMTPWRKIPGGGRREHGGGTESRS